VSTHAVTAEHRIVVLSEEPASPVARTSRGPQRPGVTMAATLAVAGILCFATFVAGGGLSLAPMTTFELTFTLAAGALLAGVVVFGPVDARVYGLWALGLLLAFTALTGLSVVWSVAPDASWQDAGRMLSYSGVFAAALALAWIAPGGWRALLGGIVLAAVVVCGYALLTKVLPNELGTSTETNFWARLQEPFGYWNAIGLTGAMGAIGCLWLGARRAGHALLNALSYPAMGLMILTVMLAYSRGALVALTVGTIVWMCVVPLRLRGARVLIVGGLGAAAVVGWDFSTHALSSNGVALASRVSAGHQLGVLIGAMLVVLTLVGIAIGFFGDRRAPSVTARRAVGIALAALLALAVLTALGGLAATKRGLTGTISHDLSSLTNPNAPVPANTPGRLTAVGSVRARYWKEALQIFAAHPALGAGAAGYETARLRYRKVPLDVRQAHGYVVQTLADLGLAGLAITLVLLFAWMVAAGRPTHPFDRRWTAKRSPPELAWRAVPTPYTPERVGLLTMLCVVITFGVHSFADWTWYVPGDACVALLCAGWLAGRGGLPAGNLAVPAGTLAAAVPAPILETPAAQEESSAPTQLAPDRAYGQSTSVYARSDSGGGQSDSGYVQGASGGAPGTPNGVHNRPLWRPPSARELGRIRVGLAIALVAGALLAAWTEWQPQRSVEASEQAVALLSSDPDAALGAAQAGVERDPLSAVALFRLSAVQRAIGENMLARTTLQKAVRLQPSDPETWLALGEYDLSSHPRAAVEELRAAVYLNPLSIPTQNAYVRALQATSTATASRRSKANALSPSERQTAQKRLRLALASKTRRAPGTPLAPRTATSSKPKSVKRATSARRV
jgi:hypothetical protein